MLKKIIAIFILISLAVFAEEAVDETALFADENSVVESKEIVNNKLISEDTEKTSVSISGEINSAFNYSITKEYLKGSGGMGDNKLLNYMSGNLMLDIRLKQGIKGFANVQAGYFPQNEIDKTLVDLKEFFIDTNISKRVYFRTGKQVLQWGRSYLWNPTDLINIDKKGFLKEVGYREGAYGLKMHVPFGTSLNIYEFIDSTNSNNINEPAVASKVEFLVGNTEMSLSNWFKKYNKPMYGFDISSRLFNIDLRGEMSLSYGENTLRFKEENGKLMKYMKENEWIPKLSAGFTKSFDFGEIKDRISLTGECYYNHSGYEDNFFKDKKEYQYNEAYLVKGADGMPIISDFDFMTKKIIYETASKGTKKDYFMKYNNLYDMNNMSKYYAALFTSVSKFIISDITFNFNLIANLNDKSFLTSTGLSYANTNDLSLTINLNAPFGDDDCEYTADGNGFTTQILTGIKF